RDRSGCEIKQLVGLLVGEQSFPVCRASQFLISAAAEAMRTACLLDRPAPETCLAVVVGSALGGIAEAERWYAQPGDLQALATASYDGPTRDLARWLGATGPVLTISTACASGATSLG